MANVYDTKFIIHITSEIVILGSLSYIFYNRIKNLEEKIKNLEEEIKKNETNHLTNYKEFLVFKKSEIRLL